MLPIETLAKLANEDIAFDEFEALRKERKTYVREFSWAIPSDSAIRRIAEFSPILEIGAGTGYWAKLLTEVGADVLGFDAKHSQRRHFDVASGGPEMALQYPTRTLLLCWPPLRSPMAVEALRNFTSEFLIYIGEEEGGCTANQEFFNELSIKYSLVEEIEIPKWPGIHDKVWIFRRHTVNTATY